MSLEPIANAQDQSFHVLCLGNVMRFARVDYHFGCDAARFERAKKFVPLIRRNVLTFFAVWN